jgi:hypothetical protein
MVITIIPVNTHNTDCGFSLPFQASPIWHPWQSHKSLPHWPSLPRWCEDEASGIGKRIRQRYLRCSKSCVCVVEEKRKSEDKITWQGVTCRSDENLNDKLFRDTDQQNAKLTSPCLDILDKQVCFLGCGVEWLLYRIGLWTVATNRENETRGKFQRRFAAQP